MQRQSMMIVQPACATLASAFSDSAQTKCTLMWLACSCDPRAVCVGRPRHNRRFRCPALLCCHERRRPAHCHGLHHGRHGVGAYGCNDISDRIVIASLQRSRARSGSGRGVQTATGQRQVNRQCEQVQHSFVAFRYQFEDMLSLRVCSSACMCMQAHFSAPSCHQLGCRGVTSESQLQCSRQGTWQGKPTQPLRMDSPSSSS